MMAAMVLSHRAGRAHGHWRARVLAFAHRMLMVVMHSAAALALGLARLGLLLGVRRARRGHADDSRRAPREGSDAGFEGVGFYHAILWDWRGGRTGAA